MKPFRESAPDRYCRLFAPSAMPRDVDRYCENLTALGQAMIDDGSRVSDQRPEILVDCGYTYFGQFIAHDLTKDASSIDEAWQKEPEEFENSRSPRLDLDSLYGGGPSMSPEFYQEDGVRLRVEVANSADDRWDICTGARGERILADERNAENLILRQMTAVFAHMHNFAVEQFEAEFSDPQMLFERARRQTQWQFQWLICNDYLPTLLNRNVYNRIFQKERSIIAWKRFSIPIEFSAAAMRFGHAMVRQNYKFGFGNDMLLENAFGRTDDHGPLIEEQQLNWGFFFQGAGDGGAVTARPIDTRISEPLHDLPADLIGVPEIACPHFRFSRHPAQLAVRTLLRGAGLRLPSGQTVAHAFGQPVLTTNELRTSADGYETEQGAILRNSNLLNETPLWYYILKESELLENGNRVGPTGSYLMAETIYRALRSDPNSYFNLHSVENFPPIWDLPDGRARIYGLSELFRTMPLLQTDARSSQSFFPRTGDEVTGSS